MSKTSPVESLWEKFDALRVLCVGDLMLDHFVYGSVERISPEAPIPVLNISREMHMPGGAGNVVRNIVALNAHAVVVGVIGDDDSGRTLEELLAAEKKLSPRLLKIPGRPTSLKTRYVAGGQQVLRADRETAASLSDQDEDKLCLLVESELEACHVVILSDYAKGTLSTRVIGRITDLARRRGKKVIADPKSKDFARYRGVNILTPNAKELAAATNLPVGDDRSAELAAHLAVTTNGFDAILLTRSERGMTLAPKDGPALHFAARTREVYDVSGAGDTVIAVFALALAAGAGATDAAALANIAAGIAVGKAGTAVVRPDELAQAHQNESLQGASAKIKTLDAALDTVTTWRARNLKIGFTNGCFDLIHPGHVSLLKQARAACDRLIVGLNTDQSVRQLKGPTRPVNNELARSVVLAALESVDAVVLFGEQTPMRLIESICPDVLIKGADYSIDKVVGAELVQSYGGKIVLAELTPGQSTTNIVERMAPSSQKGTP